MIPDSHAHLDLIGGDPSEVIDSAFRAGVSPVITIGINTDSSRDAVRIADMLDNVYASVGIHPNDSGEATDAEFDAVERIASESLKVVAIGETGLDYYRDSSPPDLQKESFRKHIEIARRLDKTLVVHDREAHQDVMELLEREGAGELRVVMHCYSGDGEMLSECLERGYFISFAGPVTFKKADHAREMARLTPIERLLAETDSPFLSPEPCRGKPNFPERVRLVAEKLAELHGVSLEKMGLVLASNTRRAFALKA